MAALIVFALTIDMGYYGYNRQHLDSVFFEYLDDLLSKGPEPTPGTTATPSPSQALTQMRTEIAEAGKWATRVLMFALVMGICLFLWGRVFLRRMEPVLVQWRRRSPKTSTIILALLILVPITGFHPQGPWSIARVGIPSTSYYLLAQNPIWYGGDVLLGSLAFRMSGGTSKIERLMPADEAIQITRTVLAPDALFTNARYPLVRQSEVPVSNPHQPLPNIVILYIEGLDRRFLGKSIVLQDQLAGSGTSLTDLYKDGVRTRFLPASSGVGVRLTPFLDQLAQESVFLEHFFSNGRLTHQGLFSSLCSYYSGHTKSPIKARYTYDYLCLPSLLSKAGYRTEMVIGQNRDYHQDHTALFLARNGLHQFFDESNAPPDAERLGLGLTDGEIFRVLRQRVQALREKRTPFFLAALTLSTHHPYAVPIVHPDVRLLSADRDPYLASLRYTDLELGLFFRGLEKEGLLENTIVLIMGDHGRHEYIGATDMERWVGHHTTPLFIWMDQSLRTTRTYRPRTTSTVASHVDLTPTILGLSGLLPRVSPFLGHDLSCLSRHRLWRAESGAHQ